MRRRASLLLAVAVVAGCGSSPRSAAPSTTATGALVAPKTNPAQDGAYLSHLAVVDPALSSYVTSNGDTALRALLTDGAAFCAFLARGGGVDDAMVATAAGARSVESQTHLPSSVTTFNAIDAVALVDLCPDEQRLLPADARSHVQALATQLHGRVGQAVSPSG